MTILLNGGENPNKVFFNGTDLDEVVYNGVTVWDKTMAPDNITLTTSTAKVSVGRLTFVEDRGNVWVGKKLYHAKNYKAYGNISLKIRTGQLGKTNTDAYWQLHFEPYSDSDIVGLPDGWQYTVYVLDTAYVPLGCYDYTTVGEQAVIGDRVMTGHFSLSRTIIAGSHRTFCLVKSAFDGDYIVKSESDKWKYYGQVSVNLLEPVSS